MAIRHRHAATQGLQMKNSMQRGQLIERGMVAKSLFGYLEALSAELFDLCENQADRILAIAKGNADSARVQLIETLRGEHSRAIQSAKHKISKVLND
jgi:hypothetical protein